MNPEPIFRIASGFMASKLLFAAGEFGLFEQLADGPASAEELAARTHAPVRSLRVVADAMVAIGLLTLDCDQYRNSEEAQAFLTGRTATDLRPALRFWDRLSYPAWEHLVDAVRSVDAQEHAFSFTADKQSIFSAGIDALSAPAGAALASTYDFSRHRRLLDLGGGTGSFVKAIRRRYPHLHAALFEQPPAVAFARARFSEDEAAHIQLFEGDMLRGPLPSDYDAVVLANVVHGFGEDTNAELVGRANDAAPDRGRILIVDMFVDATRTAPLGAALMSADFLVRTGGRAYSVDEVRGWLEAGGWRIVEHRPLAGPAGLIVGEKIS